MGIQRAPWFLISSDCSSANRRKRLHHSKLIFYPPPPPTTSLVPQMVKRLPTRQETRVRSLGREDPLEKEIATPLQDSWLEKSPRTEDPGRLQSMGSQSGRCPVWRFDSLYIIDIPDGLDGGASTYNTGDSDLIPGSGRSRGEGNGNPLQYPCLENPIDGGT